MSRPNPANYYDAIRQSCSDDRLSSYQLNSNEDELTVLTRYLWNMALGQALYPALQTCEIVLRNNIHSALTLHFGTDQWFQPTAGALLPAEQQKASETMQKVAREHAGQIGTGHVIAELTFGFWVALFDRRYDQKLWPVLFNVGFQSVPPANRARHIFLPRLEPIRKLRNRVFHHEPIWRTKNLEQQHVQLVEVIEWLAPEMAATIRIFDQFDAVYTQDLNTNKQQLELYLKNSGYLP